MMKIKYKIELLSEWHIGSGLDAGVEADLVVLKDEDGLPYIPGKTIKGLLKDALIEISEVSDEIKSEDIAAIFGNESEGYYSKTKKAFFSNAELGKAEKKEIISSNLSEFLYKNIASTKIDKNGIAQAKSLRTIEVCIPVTLYGEIDIENDKADYIELLKNAMKWTRHIGINRNRGLGRCRFTLLNENH